VVTAIRTGRNFKYKYIQVKYTEQIHGLNLGIGLGPSINPDVGIVVNKSGEPARPILWSMQEVKGWGDRWEPSLAIVSLLWWGSGFSRDTGCG